MRPEQSRAAELLADGLSFDLAAPAADAYAEQCREALEGLGAVDSLLAVQLLTAHAVASAQSSEAHSPAAAESVMRMAARLGDELAHAYAQVARSYFLTKIRELSDDVRSVTGEVTVTFADEGSMTTAYDGWTISSVSQGIPTTINRVGTDVGSFTADDTLISVKDLQMGSTLEVSTAGHAMTVTPTPIDYVDAAYTCSATVASITTPDGPLRLICEVVCQGGRVKRPSGWPVRRTLRRSRGRVGMRRVW